MRLGIIGGGIMGERLLRAAQGHPDVQVAGLWDPSADATGRLVQALPGLAVLRSAEAVVAASECVYVASPPATHLAHARAALAAGRALFCEKPLATDVADAERFVREAAGARAAVNFPFASAAPVARIGQWLRDGALGTVREATIEVGFATWPRGWQHAAASWLDGRAEGGFTREVVSHFLFLARRLLGPLTLLDAQAGFPEAGRSERTLRATLRAGDVPLALTGSVGATAHDDTNAFVLHGTESAVRLRDWATAERLHDGAWVGDPDALPHAQARPLVLQRQLAAVARMTRGEAHPLATLAEAFEVQGVVEAMVK